MTDSTCAIPGCLKPRRSKGVQWCKMHYHRWYRHGSPYMVASESGVTASHGRRYRSLYAPRHPLATANGRVYEHRMVLYDVIGPGPHDCYWCGTDIDWLPRGDPRTLQADHLNGVGDDNRPENLVPACGPCNTARGSQARAEALREAGWWSRNDTIAGLKSGGRAVPVEERRLAHGA